MPSPILVNETEVVNTFKNLEADLRRIVRRALRGQQSRAAGMRIVEELVTLVRARWDGAPSVRHWWTQMDGASLSTVSLNSLYSRLRNLEVPMDRVLQAVARAYGWLASPLLIVDDTSVQKYGVWMDGVSSVRVANVKSSVLGHTVVTLMLSTPGGALFLDHHVKVNPSKPRLARHAGRPTDEIRKAQSTKKWEMALDLLAKARAEGLDAAWILFDCAYFNAGSEVPRRLSEAHATFISKAKKSDVFIVEETAIKAKDFQRYCCSYKRVRQTDHFFYQKVAALKDGTPVKLVATWFFRGNSMKKSRAVLVTNNLSAPGALVVLTYLKRWETERGYQDWKRSMGGMAYHSTDYQTMRNFVWIGFIAYALARRARQLLALREGLPTLLAVRRRAVRTMMSTRKLRGGEPESLTQRAA